MCRKGEFVISTMVRSLADDKIWKVSSMYGPQEVEDKIRFLEELAHLGQQVQVPWIINGDFNLVSKEEERSTRRINRRTANKFRHTLNSLGLHDMPLAGRCFTWCNGQEQTVMAPLDRLLFNNEWEDLFPISDLTPLSSNISDHCPLLLSVSRKRPRAHRFRFENFWCKIPRFLEVVREAWEETVNS